MTFLPIRYLALETFGRFGGLGMAMALKRTLGFDDFVVRTECWVLVAFVLIVTMIVDIRTKLRCRRHVASALVLLLI